jgi:hypothetical protein
LKKVKAMSNVDNDKIAEVQARLNELHESGRHFLREYGDFFVQLGRWGENARQQRLDPDALSNGALRHEGFAQAKEPAAESCKALMKMLDQAQIDIKGLATAIDDRHENAGAVEKNLNKLFRKTREALQESLSIFRNWPRRLAQPVLEEGVMGEFMVIVHDNNSVLHKQFCDELPRIEAELGDIARTTTAQANASEPAGSQAIQWPTLDEDNSTVILANGTCHGLTTVQYRVVARLITAGGGWCTSADLRWSPHSAERIDHIIWGRGQGGLPEDIKNHIESRQGAGYRWLTHPRA